MNEDQSGLGLPGGTLDVGDGRLLAWDEHGPADGPAVFYLHGSPGCRVQWSGIGEHARAAGIRLIAPDRPGCGASSFQADRHINDWPSDLAALADHLELDQYWVLGASGGGPYALACAAAADPRLVRVAVTSGVGPLDAEGAIQRLNDINRGIFEAAADGIDALAPIMTALVSGPEGSAGSMGDLIASLPPEDQSVVRGNPGLMEQLIDLSAAAVSGVEGLAYDIWLLTQPWGFDLASIEIEVDFYAGDRDLNVPLQHLLDQSALVPHSTLTVWPSAGHVEQMVRLPEVLARLTR